MPSYLETHLYLTDPNLANVLDSDGDGVPDYVETAIDGTNPLDSYSYKDSDGDGVSDYHEIHVDGTNPANPADAIDTDGDGVPDYLEVLDGTNPNDPTDARYVQGTVDATALFTKVTRVQLVALGLVGASDTAACCGAYPVSATDGEPLFAPGRNRITWAGAGLNVINVRPLVSLGADEVVTEGQTGQFTIWLNGTSPVYPLTIPYEIAGTADASDHDLTSGAVTFTSGQTQATVTFHVTADTLPENDETIVRHQSHGSKHQQG